MIPAKAPRPGHALALAGLLTPPFAAVTPLALAPLLAVAVVAMLSYGFWQAWLQSSLWLIAALVIATAPGPRGTAADR